MATFVEYLYTKKGIKENHIFELVLLQILKLCNIYFSLQNKDKSFTYTFENDRIDIGIQDFVGCLPNFHSIG